LSREHTLVMLLNCNESHVRYSRLLRVRIWSNEFRRHLWRNRFLVGCFPNRHDTTCATTHSHTIPMVHSPLDRKQWVPEVESSAKEQSTERKPARELDLMNKEAARLMSFEERLF